MAEKHLLKRICSRCFIIQPAFGMKVPISLTIISGLFLLTNCVCMIFREIKTDTESFRERLSVGLICRNMTLCAKNEGLSCGGGGASGQSVVMCYVREAHNIFTDALYPDQGTYSNLGHEYGHVRGATDLYQYMIAAEDNPVSHEKLTPPKCNMGTGYRVWSDYCSALFNYTAKMRPLDKDLSDKVFPRKLVIKVGKMGKPLSNCTVNFYGTRAGGKYNKRDVYPKAYRTYTTSKRGIIEITDLYKLYHPDMTDANIPPKEPQDLFPYSYWFSFLVEIIDEVGQKKYVWLPDVDLQREHLETGNDTYTVNVTF